MANLITATRFAFALLLLLAEPFSAFFWLWYLCGGISDLLDGAVARKLDQQSDNGAKLDSMADFLFILCVGIAVIRNAAFPVWAMICALVIAIIRLAAYGIGYIKYRTFSALHTVLNKATGGFLLAFPFLYLLFGVTAACGIVCSLAFVSSVEELILTIRFRDLNRNRKSFLAERRNSVIDVRRNSAGGHAKDDTEKHRPFKQ